MTPPTDRLVVGFDGACGFCTRWVVRLHRWDRHDRLRFAPLATPDLAHLFQADLPSVQVLADGRLYVRSAAVRRILRELGPVGRALALLLAAVPTRVADAVYDGIAARRHQLTSTCERPDASLRRALYPWTDEAP